MFDMFNLFVFSHSYIFISSGSCALACILASSHQHILVFVCTCLYSRIVTSSYPQIHVPLLASMHPDIIRFMCACLYPSRLTSPYCQVRKFQLVSSHPSSSYSQVHNLVCILVSLHLNIIMLICACLHTCFLISSINRLTFACWYHRTVASSYPQIYVCFLACLYPQVNVFSIRVNDCILPS